LMWWLLPKYQRVKCEWFERVRRRVGGGFVSRETGQVWPSWFSLNLTLGGLQNAYIYAQG